MLAIWQPYPYIVPYVLVTWHVKRSPVATGVFGGLCTLNKALSPHKLKRETLSGVLVNFIMSRPPEEQQIPLLKAFWRRFW